MSTTWFAFWLATSTLPAQEVSSGELRERVTTIAEEALREDGLSGLGLAVGIGSDLLLEGGWGSAPDGSPASPESSYPAGSLLEQFTIAAVLQLVAEGELRLETPIAEHIPELRREEGDAITLAHLLSQTSGLPGYADLLARDRDLPTPELLAALAQVPPDNAPGECFAYSDTNHLLLARLLEQVSGTPLAEYLELHVFEPLEMEGTVFLEDELPRAAYAGSSQEVLGEVLECHFHGPDAGRLSSTAADLLRWQRGIAERALLDERTTRLMIEPWELGDGTSTGAGFGVNRTSLAGFEGYTYGGGMAGARVHVAYYAPLDLTIALLTRGDEDAPARIERRIARAVFDVPEPGVHDRPLSGELRELYAGAYQIGCNRVDIVVRGERLAFVSVEREFELLYQGSHHAFLSADDPEIRVGFEVQDGRVTGFVLEEAGVRSIGVRFQHG